MQLIRSLLPVVLLLCASLAAADEVPPPDAVAEAQKLIASLKYQKGAVTLGDGLAQISLPEGYRFLDSADTEKVLVDLWGNPRGGRSLGMIVPANFNPLAGNGWAAVLSFDDDGYVKDDDAAKINYNDLLKQMQEEVAESSK